MSATSETFTGLTLHYRFPSDEDAELAPQTLGEALESFDGKDLVETAEVDVLGCDVVLRVSCQSSASGELRALEDGLTGLLENWASSSGGYLVI